MRRASHFQSEHVTVKLALGKDAININVSERRRDFGTITQPLMGLQVISQVSSLLESPEDIKANLERALQSPDTKKCGLSTDAITYLCFTLFEFLAEEKPELATQYLDLAKSYNDYLFFFLEQHIQQGFSVQDMKNNPFKVLPDNIHKLFLAHSTPSFEYKLSKSWCTLT